MVRRIHHSLIYILNIGGGIVLIAISLFLFNDWRAHQSAAAAANLIEQPIQTPPGSPGSSGVTGTVRVSPDGSIRQVGN